jgi:xanthine/uracil permease
MILTVTTVVVLVIGVLSLFLALYGGSLSLSITETLQGDEDEKHDSEQRYYLLGMIGMIVLFARILNVPIFFWMIQSLVPYCPGAMCSYGVFNVGFPYSIIALVLKIILPFIYGLWLIVEVSNRRQPTTPLIGSLARSFVLFLLPLVLIDSAVDVLLVSSIRPIYAPCCSSVYDVDPPFSPSALFGPQFGMMIALFTIVVSLLLIAVQWSENKSRYIPPITLILSGIVSLLYLITLHDTLAPLVLGLSEHHCPYCLFQEFPDTAIFTGLFWIGIATAGWRVLLEMIWRRNQLPLESITGLKSILLKISSLSILFSIVSLISHLLIAI